MREEIDEIVRWINAHLFIVLAGISAIIAFFIILICLCLICRCKRGNQDESCEPLHYPSSTLQYVRFNHVVKSPSSQPAPVKI